MSVPTTRRPPRFLRRNWLRSVLFWQSHQRGTIMIGPSELPNSPTTLTREPALPRTTQCIGYTLTAQVFHMEYGVQFETLTKTTPTAVVRRRANLHQLAKVIPDACGL